MKLKNLLATILALALLFASNAYAADKVEFWTMSMKPKFIPYFTEIVKSYEAKNPGVQVEWVDYPWDVIQAKLVSRVAAGKPPALVYLNVPWAEEYARQGVIVPVDSLIASVKSSYTKGAIDDVTFNGKIYGFPQSSNIAVIAYNTKLFKAAGLSGAPKSLAEQIEFAKQIHAKTGKAGFGPQLGKVDGLFLQQGLPLIKDNKAIFNSPKHIELIEKLADAYKEGALLKDNLFAEDNFPSLTDAYKGGRVGMFVAPPVGVKRIQGEAKDVYAITDIAPAPLGPTKIADGGWLFHFAVPKGVDPKLMPAIGKFAQFLTNADNQLEFCKASGAMPTSVKAAKDSYFQSASDNAGAFEKAVSAAAGSMKYARTLYVAGVPDYDELRRVLVKAVEGGVTGKKDIKTSLDAAVATWNKKLAK
jgi:putative chitobiose transport system substrate-binding protein